MSTLLALSLVGVGGPEPGSLHVSAPCWGLGAPRRVGAQEGPSGADLGCGLGGDAGVAFGAVGPECPSVYG